MKSKLFLLAILAASVLASCNSDVELGAYENIPEVAEHVLGMTRQEATDYLATQGFYFGRIMENGAEYVFSRDKKLSKFSYEASSIFAFGAIGDTVQYANGLQRMDTEKKASDLYCKWSHYTSKVTWPKVYRWSGHVSLKKEEQNPYVSRYFDYYDGTSIEQKKKQLTEQYNNGEITQEEYDSWMQTYAYDRKRYWSDLRNAEESEDLYSAYEIYNTEEASAHPKETTLTVYMNNGGNIELYYKTTYNFVWRWK